MEFTVHFPGGATSQVSFSNGVKHPDKKKTTWDLANEYAHDMGGMLRPYPIEPSIPVRTKKEKDEVKKAKLSWKSHMKSKYVNFTVKKWAKSNQSFIQ